jgi:hypothetical protein
MTGGIIRLNGGDTKMRYKRRLRLTAAALVLVAAVGLFYWWLFRDRPLTAEEQQLVGWWKLEGGVPVDPRSANQVVSEGIEYRPDRTIRYRKVDRRTGAVSYEGPPWEHRWSVVNGHLITVYKHPSPLNALTSGNFRGTFETDYLMTRDGSDSYRLERVDLPPGVVWPPLSYRRWDHSPDR